MGDAALSDAQLIERFVARRDEAAFELLVWRHGAMVLNLCRQLRRNPIPYLVGLATASNIGSVATITGNPQNIIIGSLSQIGYLRFAARLSPIACAGLIVNFAIVALVYRRSLCATTPAAATRSCPMPASTASARFRHDSPTSTPEAPTHRSTTPVACNAGNRAIPHCAQMSPALPTGHHPAHRATASLSRQ